MRTLVFSLWLSLLLSMPAWLPGCGRDSPAPSGSGEAAKPPAGSLEVTLVYGSEKKKWIDQATETFNAAQHKSTSGKPIFVTAVPMGSGECMEAILSGRIKADLASPASGAFIKLANAESRAKGQAELVGQTDNLVLSPVVIAMWKPMAEALGWRSGQGGHAIGWAEILALAKDPRGWASRGHPEWGKFRFGHTHPEYSNSGLISVIAESYAAVGKTRDLSPDDLAKPAAGTFIHDIEASVVHYGSSTGFFADKMFANGPKYLSAAVLYESLVVDSYSTIQDATFPVVAIYPKEGTFWSDHPVGLVNREWVTPEHKDAAQQYIKFLLSADQQKKAMAFGFRPADVAMALESPLDAAHGIDPTEPRTLLEVPSPETINAVLDLWRANKKHANVVLVLDTSGSMSEQNKMPNAKAGAAELIKMLSDEDEVSLVPFSTATRWAEKRVSLKTGRQRTLDLINGLYAEGNTRLFNTIAEAYDYLQSNPTPERTSAVVVLTDGADTAGQMSLEQLLDHIRFDAEGHTTRVFTIGYGDDAQASELRKIADQTQAKYYDGKPENIREVFKEIATFF